MSQFFIRKGVKTGKIKHMRSGNKIYIHIPALLETLDTMCGVNSKKHNKEDKSYAGKND